MTKTEFKEVVNLALSKGNNVFIPEFRLLIKNCGEFYELSDEFYGIYLRNRNLDELINDFWKIFMIVGGEKWGKRLGKLKKDL